MLSSNQNAGFFCHQYLWKESISNFMHDDIQRGEVVSETTTFG